MIKWRDVGFPDGIIAIPPGAMGIKEGAYAFNLKTSDGSNLDYFISGSFAFIDDLDDPSQMIYGFTALLPSSKDKDAFDDFNLNDLSILLSNGLGVPLNSVSSITNAKGIGNLSAGVKTQYNRQGETWQISMVSFRAKGIGAWVFVRNNANLQSPVVAEKVARVYANSIQQPEISCKLISVESDTNADVPTFNFEAEGFYPYEGRMISLSGNIIVGEETKKGGTSLLGLGGESADKDGKITDAISFPSMDQLAAQGMDNAVLPPGPNEYTLNIVGVASGCEIEQTIIWPGDLESKDTPETLTTETPGHTTLPGDLVIPIDSLNNSVPWLPLDVNKRPTSCYFGFNLEKAPFNNLLVRQAFAAAVDRQVIADLANSLNFENVNPATSLTPPETLGRDLYEDVGISFDPTRAKNLLAEAGYTDLEKFPEVKLVVSSRSEATPGAYSRIADAIAEMWIEHLGISVEIQVFEDNSYYFSEFLPNEKYDIYQLAWGADFNDPDNFLRELFHSTSRFNHGHFYDPEFDATVDNALSSNDPAERQELYIQAERILTEDIAGIIPLYHTYYYL
ncbi:MAG: hypothetical protein KAU23_10350, partial [Anaerolineales bacterium]|nr:hypothetical protein [Anaerolineales bacterium]